MTINQFLNDCIGTWQSSRITHVEGKKRIEHNKIKTEISRVGTSVWEFKANGNTTTFTVDKPGYKQSNITRTNSTNDSELTTIADLKAPSYLILETVDTENDMDFTESIAFLTPNLRMRVMTSYTSSGEIFSVICSLEHRLTEKEGYMYITA